MLKRDWDSVRELMKRLYPGQDYEEKYQNYKKKGFQLMLIMVALGIASFICLHLCSRMQARLTDGQHLDRNEWEEGMYSVTLSAETSMGKTSFDAQVRERRLGREELAAMKEEAQRELVQVILGDNPALSEIRSDLKLVRRMEGYPFSIAWKSSDYERVGADGRLGAKELTGAESLILTAVFTYEEESWEQEIPITLQPVRQTREELYRLRLKELFRQAEEQGAEKNRVVLPKKLGEETIIWKEERENTAFWAPFVGIAAALFIFPGMERDLRKKDQKRKEELLESYPGFLSRLQLYAGAGLTVKSAFLKIGQDYQREKRLTGKRSFLYEEILVCCYEFSNGREEERVYRDWGRRCDEMNCRKLGFLLSAHLKQGNDKILTMLTKEGEEALAQRRNRIRKKGEEAGIKLLLPMTLMLVEVMFLILLPALTGIGGA